MGDFFTNTWAKMTGNDGGQNGETEWQKQYREMKEAEAANQPGGANSPVRPDWLSPLGPDGVMNPAYVLGQPGAVDFNPITAGQISTTPQIGAYDPLSAMSVSSRDVAYDPYNPAAGGAFDTLRQTATAAPGSSAWLGMAMDKQKLDEQAAVDQATTQAATGAATARTMLASRGGLRSGAGERLARDAARGLNSARSTAAREGAIDRSGLRMADEQNRLGLLGTAAGMESNIGLTNSGRDLQAAMFSSGQALDADKFNSGQNFAVGQHNQNFDFGREAFNAGNLLKVGMFNEGLGQDAAKFNSSGAFNANTYNTGNRLGVDQYNLGNLFQELGGKRQDDLTAWREKMGVLGAESNANAIEKSGKKN